jgi:8-oxo-dGTP diphosphatase
MPRAEQGVSDDRYAVIPRVLLFIFRGEEVLLLKGNPEKRIWPNRYNGIGGHIERAEDVLSAARRELQEEAGIQVDQLILCGTILVDTGDSKGVSIYIYKGEYKGGHLIESREGSLEWVSMKELDQYKLVEDLPEILPRVYGISCTDAPFSARYFYDNEDKLCIVFG